MGGCIGGWIRELLADDQARRAVLEAMDIAVIPMYNVGGALNRNCCTRTNQDGPENMGFVKMRATSTSTGISSKWTAGMPRRL